MQEPGDHTEGSDQHANTHCNDYIYHFLASQLLHSRQRILLLHKVPFIIDSLGQVGWTYTISSPTLPVLCLQVLYFSAIASAPYRFIQFLLGIVFQCNRHATIYTVQLDQLCSLIRKIFCSATAFTVDKCQFQILQVRLLATFFTAVITKLMFGAEGLCLTTVLAADM